MGKLSDIHKRFKEKWGKQSKVKKIVLSVLTVAIIGSLIYIATYLGTTKYAVLFKDMDTTDAANITAKLKADKVTYKVSGTSILVPQNQVDSVRMDVLSKVTLTNGSQGWELLDNTSKFGVTDEQMQSNYQRALQGELERTIKSFPQIDNARVIIVPSEDSAFVKDTTPASASVALQLKTNQNLTKQQVSAIISLLSGSVKNLPKENVQVVDDKMRTLSSGIFDKEGNGTVATDEDTADETTERQALKAAYEKTIEDKITAQLSPVYKDGVRVTVNADLDFDANQTTSTIVSNGQVVSENNTKETDAANDQADSTASPVDNNMTNTTPVTTTTTTTPTTKETSTKNYELSKSENTIVKAPGDIRKISASAVLNGNIDDATKTKITDLISSDIGYDAARGDSISVEGLPFDTSSQSALKKVIADMNATAKTDAKDKLYKEIGIGVGAVVLIALTLILVKKHNRNDDDLYLSDMDDTREIDEIAGDDQMVNKPEEEVEPKPIYKPIEFETDTQDDHVEREVKKYAIDKPDQVADIIKSWLANDER